MRQSISKTYVLLVLLLFGGIASAQPKQTAPMSPAARFAGEKLVYEGKVSRLKISISVAELTFTSKTNDRGELIIQTEAVSKGTLLRLFRFSFLQQYESFVDPNFRITRTLKHDVQKQRVRDSEAVFDYNDQKVTYVETDPKTPTRPPRRIASEIPAQMNDMVSAIYFLRAQEIKVGMRFDVPVSDSGLVYNVPVVVAARERQKTAIGEKWCFRIEPEIFGKGRLIEQKGKMTLWLADDAFLTPVRSVINSELGKIEVKVRSATPPSR
ncbi:MAG: DUF3108 domain-containing protein [Acidobacteriota bacterium]|nr:MAG: DUF3108 domain-containing protein [Acidobacteriota bacterium]